MVHLYYGDGKGKTTRAIGRAIRYAGAGNKVLFCQFMKDGTSSEVALLNSIENIEYMCVNENFGFSWEMSDAQRQITINLYKNLIEKVCKDKKLYSMIVLDELVTTVKCGLIDEKFAIDTIRIISDCCEVVMTGHVAEEIFIDASDYVTEMKKIKHPYDKGAFARKGIEY